MVGKEYLKIGDEPTVFTLFYFALHYLQSTL